MAPAEESFLRDHGLGRLDGSSSLLTAQSFRSGFAGVRGRDDIQRGQ
jgi:hypothetical protein